MRERALPGTPLYVHLPYCKAKCAYCDFYSLAGEEADAGSVVRAILAEAEEWAPEAPRTVFFGGGTPSMLSVEHWRELLDGLDERTGFRASAEEVTAECNPESLDLDKASALLELGVPRLSVGIQSLRPETLQLFGRVHSADQGLAALEAARAAGCRDLSADLIYAAPGQTEAEWREDLTAVLALRPDHFSAYNLTYEEGTLFTQWLRAGRLEQAPEELELSLFWATRAVARSCGYDAYEVSNFSVSGHQCDHNVSYWHNGPYVGLGPSAVSKVGFTRSGNPRSLNRWLAALEAGEDPAEWDETPEPVQRLGETWWLGLRLAEGLDPARARETAGWERPDDDPAPELAARLVEQGLLAAAGGRFRLTERGLPLADAVARAFLALEAPTRA